MLPITIQGTVIPGDKQGRTIGFPTANLATLPDPEEIGQGVYAARCRLNDQQDWLVGLAYFGPRLVFGETTLSFEVYLLDFHQTIYDQQLTVELLKFMRPPKAVANMNELQALLEQDVQEITKLAIIAA